MSKTTMNRCTVLGTPTRARARHAVGDGNSITSCTFGPSAGVGVHALEAEAITMVGCTVSAAGGTGVDLTLSTLTLMAVSIDNCTTAIQGDERDLHARGPVRPRHHRERGARPSSATSRARPRCASTAPRLDLGRFLVVKGGGVLNVTNTTLSFRLLERRANGIVVEAQGALGMADCVVGSPGVAAHVFRLMSFSIFELRTTTISNIARRARRPSTRACTSREGASSPTSWCRTASTGSSSAGRKRASSA